MVKLLYCYRTNF